MQTVQFDHNSAASRARPNPVSRAPLQQWDAATPWRATPLPGENLLQLAARVRRERRWFGLLELI